MLFIVARAVKMVDDVSVERAWREIIRSISNWLLAEPCRLTKRKKYFLPTTYLDRRANLVARFLLCDSLQSHT